MLSRGLWAGIMATGPMTLVMLEFFKKLPREERSPLPPAILTRELLPVHSPTAEREMSWISHFAFGGACGIFYSLVERWLGPRSWVKGPLFGLFIWASSYLGWIPSLNLRPAARNMPLSRNTMMILAHLAWGLTLGRALEDMKNRESALMEGHRRAPSAD